MNQKRDDETTGEELFMEELGQVHGGNVDLRRPPLFLTLGIRQAEQGTQEPITTQALREIGPTLPPPFNTVPLGESITAPPPQK